MTPQSAQPILPAYPSVTPLRAGPISLLFVNGDLRQLRINGVEIVQRIYVAVRDQGWGTIPMKLHDLEIDDQGDSFEIHFLAVHQQNEIGFTWKGTITGGADGTIAYVMDGHADTTFKRNRLGICLLHPATAAGARATLTHSNGSQSTSRFPADISPHQPFMDLQAIAHEFAPNQQVEVSFEGDIFESEDQRNWTDASYKTYSTPLTIPYPVTVEKGTKVRQAINIRLLNPPATPADSDTTAPSTAAPSTPATVTIGDESIAALPALGLGSASHGEPLTPNEVQHLRALKLSHLRVDLDLGQEAAQIEQTLARATHDANAINAALEIALFVGKDEASELAKLQQAFAKSQPTVVRWLLFARHTPITPRTLAENARPILTQLAPDALLGGGTNLYFTHINRTHPPVDVLDFVTYSLNPQVHAFDLISLVENMTAQPTSITSARTFSQQRPIVISPITLRPRFNADATGSEAPPPPGVLPDAVDVRQSSGFAAAWTLGSLSGLANAGVSSLTYFETTGWRGMMETEQGSPLPDQFESEPGKPFPLYHLFEALAAYAGGKVIATSVNEPHAIAALTLTQDNRQCTIVGNLRDTPQPVTIHGAKGQITLETLGDSAGNLQFTPEQETLEIDLAPYSLVKIETGQN